MHSEPPPPPSVCPSFLCILCKQSQDLLWRSPEVLPMLGLSAHIQARVSWDITASNCSLLHLSWSSPSSHKKPMGHMQFSFHLLLSSMKTTTSKKPWPGDYTGILPPATCRHSTKEQARQQNCSVRPSGRSTGQSQRPSHWAALTKKARIQALVPAHHPGLHLEKPSCGLQQQQQLSTAQLLTH